MASETTTAVERPTEQVAWKGGALAGLLGGIVIGAILIAYSRGFSSHRHHSDR